MTVWSELKTVLADLRDQRPGTLLQCPSLRVDDGGPPPFKIWLEVSATATAEELHRRFGHNVELTVGALPFPPDSRPQSRPKSPEPIEQLDPMEMAVELDGPAIVPSGQTHGHGLLLTNLTGNEVQLMTNGQVTAMIVDPGTGDVVGGVTGFQALPLITYSVPPGQTERVPLLIGTTSSVPRLGYAIPAGNWGMQAILTFGPPRRPIRRRTPILPLTITN